MPVSPFTNYNSNERDVVIPSAPQKCTTAIVSAAGTVVCDVVTLTAQNLSNGTVIAYAHYLALFSLQSAAASGAQVTWQWQFRNSSHVNVGAAVSLFALVGGSTGATSAGVLNNPIFSPAKSWWQSLTIPATATEIVLQRSAAVAGSPSVTAVEEWGIDPLNAGVPGDIGGGGMVAASATSLNQF